MFEVIHLKDLTELLSICFISEILPYQLLTECWYSTEQYNSHIVCRRRSGTKCSLI